MPEEAYALTVLSRPGRDITASVPHLDGSRVSCQRRTVPDGDLVRRSGRAAVWTKSKKQYDSKGAGGLNPAAVIWARNQRKPRTSGRSARLRSHEPSSECYLQSITQGASLTEVPMTRPPCRWRYLNSSSAGPSPLPQPRPFRSGSARPNRPVPSAYLGR